MNKCYKVKQSCYSTIPHIVRICGCEGVVIDSSDVIENIIEEYDCKECSNKLACLLIANSNIETDSLLSKGMILKATVSTYMEKK